MQYLTNALLCRSADQTATDHRPNLLMEDILKAVEPIFMSRLDAIEADIRSLRQGQETIMDGINK